MITNDRFVALTPYTLKFATNFESMNCRKKQLSTFMTFFNLIHLRKTFHAASILEYYLRGLVIAHGLPIITTTACGISLPQLGGVLVLLKHPLDSIQKLFSLTAFD